MHMCGVVNRQLQILVYYFMWFISVYVLQCYNNAMFYGIDILCSCMY